jgi:hypothetical protein
MAQLKQKIKNTLDEGRILVIWFTVLIGYQLGMGYSSDIRFRQRKARERNRVQILSVDAQSRSR